MNKRVLQAAEGRLAPNPTYRNDKETNIKYSNYSSIQVLKDLALYGFLSILQNIDLWEEFIFLIQ